MTKPSKTEILEALQKLDPTDDTHWTDDGAPRMDALQNLTDDKTLTRAQVNDAAPQFSRPKAGEEPGVAPPIQAASEGNNGLFDDGMDPEVDGPGEQLTEDQVRAILARRIRDSEAALQASRAATNEARAEERRAEQRVTRATADFQRRFPPISQAENIKQHLASQQQRLMDEVAYRGDNGRGQLDIAMQRRNSRGWSRPSRPVQNTVVRAG